MDLRFKEGRLLILLLTSLYSSTCMHCQSIFGGEAAQEIGKTTAQLLQLGGYTAINHYITVEDGYILNLVEAYNPELIDSVISSFNSVLFIHGFVNSGNTWLVDSVGAQPRDYSNICPNATDDQLLQLAESDPGFRSIPITFMNCGRRVWLVNRRGNTQSRGYANQNLAPYSDNISNTASTLFGGSLFFISNVLSNVASLFPVVNTANFIFSPFTPTVEDPYSPRYWNFSLDDEARSDFHSVIDYILEQTGKPQIDLVAHSSGGQITLMAQVLQPEVAHKINRTLLYAPSMYMSLRSNQALAAPLLPALVSYLGQFPPNFLLYPARALIETVCATEVTRSTICSLVLQAILGADGFSEPVRPGYTDGLLDTTSSHHFAQLIRTALQLKTHFFDYLDPLANLAKYGSIEPPLYNVSRIIAPSMAIFYGNSDGLVPDDGVRALINDLPVPVTQYYINKTGVLWNHFSYFFDEKEIPSLLAVPSVQYLYGTN